jgi:hypothetical protein
MKRSGILLVVLVACGSKKGGDSAPKVGAKPISAGTVCPIPKEQGITERFAVGAVPDYRVPDFRSDHGMLCHDDFPASDVIKIQNGKPTIVTEGTFTGSCKEAPTPRTYDAVKAAKIGIEVNGLAIDQGELGMDKPVVVDSKTPDKMASVAAVLLDRCGEKLDEGNNAGPTTWTPGDGCDKVAKLVPWTLTGPADPTAAAMQIAAVGPGTCKFTASRAGVTGDVQVTVK